MKGKSILLLVAILLALACTSTASAAPASKVPFSATIVVGTTGDPERSWVDEEGMHIRGWVISGSISGDINGEVALIANLNIDFSGSGGEQVKGVITDGGLEIYRASFDITISTSGMTGTFVFIGVGSCKGTHVTGTITAGAGGAVLTGTKLTTHP